MDHRARLELIGYAASALVALSLMMRSVLRLRVINLAGAVVFAIYGMAIHAYPVAAVNLFIVGVNVWYLREMLGAREYFTLMPVERDSEYLRRFLEFHATDIARFFPTFDASRVQAPVAIFVLRDVVPAGLILGAMSGDGVLRVHLDYVIPQFRDFKAARHVFTGRAALLREMGVRVVEATAMSEAHASYLRRLGFHEQNGVYELRLQ